MSGWVALIIALTGLLGAAGGIIGLFIKVKAVHVLVNQNMTNMIQRVDQLSGALQGAGIQVPGRLNGEPPPSPVP